MLQSKTLYPYPSPLSIYTDKNLEPLPTTRSPDQKSLQNPTPVPGGESKAYTRFEAPISNGTRGGWDVHVYFRGAARSTSTPTSVGSTTQGDGGDGSGTLGVDESAYARELHERIRREFPELRIYPMHNVPIGPHPLPMFEVNIFTPAQFGAFVPWLAVWRGPLVALVHPNTEFEPRDEVGDHSQRAIWLGGQVALKMDVLEGGD